MTYLKTWKLVLKITSTETEGTHPVIGLISIHPASGIYYPLWTKLSPERRDQTEDLIKQIHLLKGLNTDICL